MSGKTKITYTEDQLEKGGTAIPASCSCSCGGPNVTVINTGMRASARSIKTVTILKNDGRAAKASK